MSRLREVTVRALVAPEYAAVLDTAYATFCRTLGGTLGGVPSFGEFVLTILVPDGLRIFGARMAEAARGDRLVLTPAEAATERKR